MPLHSRPIRRLPAAALLWLGIVVPVSAAESEPEKPRTFTFVYEARVTGLPAGQSARVWLPVPPSNADQTVTQLKEELPAKGQRGRDPTYGNDILFVEAAPGKDGTLTLHRTYRVERQPVRIGAKLSPEERGRVARFLQPDRNVPIDGKPLTLLEGRKLPDDPLQLGRTLFDVVDGHLRYSKEGTGWGRGDAVWACASKYGNCTDFHSLFISLARAKKLPAKFEIGFALPAQRGEGAIAGYHCWAAFRLPGKGWVPVDVAHANQLPARKDEYFGHLPADRVTFSIGRDLTLVPKQAGPPLNFFIYPYVEVGGKPYPAEKCERSFRYHDVEPARP